jgi:predicted AAA+ superfamily ATPase
MNRRYLHDLLLDALADTPVVFLRGARQSGKTTLVKNIAGSGDRARNYVTLDSATALAAALHDPAGFLQGVDKPVTLDEVQRAPELMLAIKEDVDRSRLPGRYLLTGSANVMVLPKVAESLAGRMVRVLYYHPHGTRYKGHCQHPGQERIDPITGAIGRAFCLPVQPIRSFEGRQYSKQHVVAVYQSS